MYGCKYCNKEFKKESTLAAHLCEPKRRYQQQNETGVQLGFKAYLRFYELTQGSAKLKTYEDFVASPYYMAFVKFGRHLVAIRCINTGSFIDWLLKNNKKIDYWTKDTMYSEWMREYLKKENVKDALERALKEMQNLADEDSRLGGKFDDYFRQANANRICQHIANGRISFVETRSPNQESMQNGRGGDEIYINTWLVSLDVNSGQKLWEQRVKTIPGKTS